MSENTRPKFYDHINVYEFSCELPGTKQVVEFKPVSTGQLKKLLTYENETNLIIQERALDELISSSVLSKDFNIADIYLEDRFYLLVELRKKTKGEVLEFSLTCPQCGSQSLQRQDLNALNVKPFDENVDKSLDLGNGIIIHFRHVKRGDQLKEIHPGMLPKKMSPMESQMELQLIYHALTIDKIETPSGIDDNIPLADRKFFVENVPTGHYEKIRDKLEEITFGTELVQHVQCIKCDFKHTTDIPIENSFFS
jgi:hypothetical protein